VPDDQQYDGLASAYDFLVPDSLLDPGGSFAAFREWVEDLPRGAAVLDCACGPGHLAVGLAQAGFVVTATDASAAMIARATALAESYDVALTVDRLTWDELSDRQWDDRFAAVFCVGNSIAHAAGAGARRRALRNMSRVLRAGGRLLLTSRNWELVRSTGSRMHVADRLVVRGERRGLVIHNWVLPAGWTERHRLDVAVAVLDDREVVHTVAQELDFWPFRHEELLDDLAALGLRLQTTTYASHADRYLVVAYRDD
jgi:SAM-dependent methyltransferase